MDAAPLPLSSTAPPPFPPIEAALVRSTLHDVNNMLAAIALDAELVAECAPECAGQIDDIVAAVHTASALCQRLLVDGEPARSPALDLGDLIDDVVSGVDCSVPLFLDLAVPPPPSIDALRLRQVLDNLFRNAITAMRGRPGRLDITTALRLLGAPRPDSLGVCVRPGRYWVLTVADTGAGMSPEELGQIFRPGYSTRRGAVVSGYGLLAVSEAMAWHRGGVFVESVVGRGTRFAMWFPLG
ncbi:MAG: ATP-binding protein [bacterium]